MELNDQPEFELDHDEFDLLVWNVSNEVINGFTVDRFQERIGESEKQFKSVSNRLRSTVNTGNVKINAHEVKIYRNALALTLEQLGADEFPTRTGYDFETGQVVLRKLNDFLSGKNRLLTG